MSSLTNGHPIEILLVEDNPDDAFMTMAALREGKLCNVVHLVEDGLEALRFLHRQGEHAEAPRPDLILLDLSLPRRTGIEVLADIKDDPELRRLPVVIMTGSTREEDVVKSYDHHANCYITKPVDLEKFLGAVRKIEDFWFKIVRLPSAA